ncbi:4Fe-4S binding protein [Mycobacterium avium]|uniref:4Fe-4S binding protein n=1 Tax=Mycobacterium avium TaxID=1764 RepID=UPI00355C7559|nr:hypothetical protein [Mycobacterium avium subsp. hominissuis]
MAFVITQNCCKDASCVPDSPVGCIRPLDHSTDMLFIDPDICIDCGVCVEECPVDAIHYEDDLPPEQRSFQEINAEYFRHHPLEPVTVAAPTKARACPAGSLRVAPRTLAASSVQAAWFPVCTSPGWVKRGPRGAIGTNRSCAAETVGQLLADCDEGKLTSDVAAPEELSALLAQRGATLA